MNELAELSALGIEMPSMFSIISAIALSVVGFIVFRRGRRLKIARLTWCGLALMIYPDFVADPWVMWGVALGLGWLASQQWEPAGSKVQ